MCIMTHQESLGLSEYFLLLSIGVVELHFFFFFFFFLINIASNMLSIRLLREM